MSGAGLARIYGRSGIIATVGSFSATSRDSTLAMGCQKKTEIWRKSALFGDYFVSRKIHNFESLFHAVFEEKYNEQCFFLETVSTAMIFCNKVSIRKHTLYTYPLLLFCKVDFFNAKYLHTRISNTDECFSDSQFLLFEYIFSYYQINTKVTYLVIIKLVRNLKHII